MIEFIKKAMFTGIGLASITKDKIEDVVNEFVEQGNLTEQEGRNLVKEMMDYSDKSRTDLEDKIDNYIEKAIIKFDLAKRGEIEELRRQLAELQLKVEDSK